MEAGFTVMAFPWVFTVPVPGPWQERQSSAAWSAVATTENAKTRHNAKWSAVTLRPATFRWIEPSGCALTLGFDIILFAGSDWGKMLMFLTDKSDFETSRQFPAASADLIAVLVPQNSTASTMAD
jgi:hypothetical protein